MVSVLLEGFDLVGVVPKPVDLLQKLQGLKDIDAAGERVGDICQELEVVVFDALSHRDDRPPSLAVSGTRSQQATCKI